ncbi:MAG: UDP-N-acetylglucosamine 2-epimerase (non-hydrolyzing) [Actinomycetota bacterium]|nr:UDP-N-acetylglucosamine 2-epimerase (non-hydrolyzing) [Actinomycetota bacterium]
MNRPKVMTVFGTRPEAIKLAPVIKVFKKSDKINSITLVTAQHREMLDQVLKLFDIRPDHDLDIMRKGQDLFTLTTKTLNGVKEILLRERPDLVLVQGDTTTTFAAALSAFYLKIPIAHVEAGLRTFDRYHPFPEEMNRVLTTHLAELHFAPTETARANLIKDGISRDKVIITGNTVIDALLSVVKPKYRFDTHPILSGVDFNSNKIILVTSHRRENWGTPFDNVCEAIKRLVRTDDDIEVVFSVHLNPNLKNVAHAILGNERRVYLVDPLDYEPFVQLMNGSYLVLTDSGGIQEEAPSLGKPVLVLRDVTERPEGVAAGTVRVIGTDVDKIIFETEELLRNKEEYDKMARAINPYGDGHAAERIVTCLEGYFASQTLTK